MNRKRLLSMHQTADCYEQNLFSRGWGPGGGDVLVLHMRCVCVWRMVRGASREKGAVGTLCGGGGGNLGAEYHTQAREGSSSNVRIYIKGLEVHLPARF